MNTLKMENSGQKYRTCVQGGDKVPHNIHNFLENYEMLVTYFVKYAGHKKCIFLGFMFAL